MSPSLPKSIRGRTILALPVPQVTVREGRIRLGRREESHAPAHLLEVAWRFEAHLLLGERWIRSKVRHVADSERVSDAVKRESSSTGSPSSDDAAPVSAEGNGDSERSALILVIIAGRLAHRLDHVEHAHTLAFTETVQIWASTKIIAQAEPTCTT